MEIAAADLVAADIDNRVVGVEFSVGVFVGLAYSCNIAYYVKSADKIHINMACVAHKTENGVILSVAAMNIKPEAL